MGVPAIRVFTIQGLLPEFFRFWPGGSFGWSDLTRPCLKKKPQNRGESVKFSSQIDHPNTFGRNRLLGGITASSVNTGHMRLPSHVKHKGLWLMSCQRIVKKV